MKLKAPNICPVCGGEYEITTLTCKKCKSELNGHFSGCDFCNLNEDDTYFVLTFLKCRGNIKDVEKELGISYPTVRGRLDSVIKKLGLAETASPDKVREERKQIFDKLNDGELTADQAAELLKNL
jgi:hypothetical protein